MIGDGVAVPHRHGVAGRRHGSKRGMTADRRKKTTKCRFFLQSAITGMELRYIMTLTDYINQYH